MNDLTLRFHNPKFHASFKRFHKKGSRETKRCCVENDAEIVNSRYVWVKSRYKS